MSVAWRSGIVRRRVQQPDVSRLIQRALRRGRVSIEPVDPARFGGPGFAVGIDDGYAGYGEGRYLVTALQRALLDAAAIEAGSNNVLD